MVKFEPATVWLLHRGQNKLAALLFSTRAI